METEPLACVTEAGSWALVLCARQLPIADPSSPLEKVEGVSCAACLQPGGCGEGGHVPQTSRRVRNLVGPSSMARSHCHHPQARRHLLFPQSPSSGLLPSRPVAWLTQHWLLCHEMPSSWAHLCHLLHAAPRGLQDRVLGGPWRDSVSLSREGLTDSHGCQPWAQWQEAGQAEGARAETGLAGVHQTGGCPSPGR